MNPLTIIYEADIANPEDLDDDATDVSCFDPNVRFVADRRPDINLNTALWNNWGNPRRVKMTLEPVAKPEVGQ